MDIDGIKVMVTGDPYPGEIEGYVRRGLREHGKRFMRMTKAEMLSTIGQCLGILIAFLDLRQSYDYLKATMDILKDENTALLNVIKQIEQEYEDADKTCFNDTRMFDRLLGQIPDRIWVE